MGCPVDWDCFTWKGVSLFLFLFFHTSTLYSVKMLQTHTDFFCTHLNSDQPSAAPLPLIPPGPSQLSWNENRQNLFYVKQAGKIIVKVSVVSTRTRRNFRYLSCLHLHCVTSVLLQSCRNKSSLLRQKSPDEWHPKSSSLQLEITCPLLQSFLPQRKSKGVCLIGNCFCVYIPKNVSTLHKRIYPPPKIVFLE